jgi:hypothetical protein
MKKLFKILGGLVVLVLIAVVCLVLFWLGPTIRKTVETVGPKAIGAPLTMEKLHIYPLRGIVQLEGLFVGNPEGFATESAVELKQFKVDVSIRSLLTDTIVVKEILLDAPVFTYERKLKTDNIAAIQKNIEAFVGEREAPSPETPAEEEKPDEEQEAPKKPAKKVIIERLTVKDALVRAKISALPTAPISIPDIEKTDIGKADGGTSWSAAAKEIGSTLYDAILGAVSNIGDAAGDALKDAGNAAMDAGGAAVDTAKETMKNIGGLFKKKE